jgi:hypothetical protein
MNERRMKKSPAENVMRAENEASALPERSPFYDTTSATLPDLEPSFRGAPTGRANARPMTGSARTRNDGLTNKKEARLRGPRSLWLTLNVG